MDSSQAESVLTPPEDVAPGLAEVEPEPAMADESQPESLQAEPGWTPADDAEPEAGQGELAAAVEPEATEQAPEPPAEIGAEPDEAELEAAQPEEEKIEQDREAAEHPTRGDVREGTIVSLDADGAVVDLGLDRRGMVSGHDLERLDPERREALEVGALVPLYVVDADPDKDLIAVSVHQGIQNEKWLEAERLRDSKDIWEGKVVGYNQRGLIVPFGNLRGFVPISHMMNIPRRASPAQIRERLGHHVGRTLPLRVIEVDRRRRRLILSHRAAYPEWRERQREAFLDTLKEGEDRDGRVRELKDFGAFVDLGGGDGLIHISEFAWHRISHPKEMLRVGQEVRVRVLKINRKRRRVALSLKRLAPHPWETLEERYHENQLIEGKITRVTDFGAFVELEPGIEGLLHAKHLPRLAEPEPSKVVAEGEVHLLRIISIDAERRRIRLSLRAVSMEEQLDWMVRKAEAAAAAMESREVIGLAELIGEEEE